MRKNKLLVSYEYNFVLLGIASPARDYKLAWHINKTLGTHLIKDEDLHIDFVGNQHVVISNFLFEKEHCTLRLLKNKAEEESRPAVAYLLPELPELDYFIMMEDPAENFPVPIIMQKLKELDIVQFLTQLRIDTLKNKENLIF
ncbi:IPExxxVDY family protein [Roseivirga sp. BDSF3-8]|uniref:IPExxxVDY family protein n=1 Tax=Roseivirga sp. BDSF3-8 TaxID=3241598 RepID=UPI0035322222